MSQYRLYIQSIAIFIYKRTVSVGANMQKKNVTYIKCDIYKGKACFQNILFFMAFFNIQADHAHSRPGLSGPSFTFHELILPPHPITDNREFYR